MEMSPEMTAVDILDYTLTNHINFEAEIRFAEDSGVVQVETFGVSLNAEGTCFYGMQARRRRPTAGRLQYERTVSRSRRWRARGVSPPPRHRRDTRPTQVEAVMDRIKDNISLVRSRRPDSSPGMMDAPRRTI